MGEYAQVFSAMRHGSQIRVTTFDHRSIRQLSGHWLCAVVLSWLLCGSSALGEIYRWDNGALIPGTRGVWPVPGVRLDKLSLTYADLVNGDLRGASMLGTNLSNAHLDGARLGLAKLDNAKVTGTRFVGNTWLGLRQEQIYTTASYQAGNLRGIQFWNENLVGWDFSEQDLTGAMFPSSQLSNANFARADISAANFGGTTSFGFTSRQLYSTGSFQRRNLRGLGLWSNDLTGWDLTNQDLTGASLGNSVLRDTRLSGAKVAGVDFSQTTDHGFTKEQLYSTVSYQSQDLQDVSLDRNNVSNWNFVGQNLAVADFAASNMTNTNFAESHLAGVYFGPVVAGDRIFASTITGANLAGANLKNASFINDTNPIGEEFAVLGLDEAAVRADTVYNQYTLFPNYFDPVAAGLRFERSVVGDLDGFAGLTVNDVDYLSRRIRDATFIPWQFDLFDLNDDSAIDRKDLEYWVVDLNRTWFGDADLDGEYNSNDLVIVLGAGEYEDPLIGNSTWATGDWNADGDFTTTDLVVSFQGGGYEAGPRRPLSESVPEPTAGVLLLSGLIAISLLRRVIL